MRKRQDIFFDGILLGAISSASVSAVMKYGADGKVLNAAFFGISLAALVVVMVWEFITLGKS